VPDSASPADRGSWRYEPIRVAILVNRLSVGGAERFAVDFVKAADRRRLYPVLISLGDENVYAEELANRDVIVETLGMQSKPTPKTLARLLLVLRKYHIEVVQTHSPLTTILAMALQLIRRDWSLACTQQTERLAHVPRWRIVNDLATRRADANIYISEGVKASFDPVHEHVRSGQVQRVIPNCVDIKEIDRYASVRREQLAEEFGIPANAFVIGHIGRLSAVKGQIHIVRALGKVRAQLPQAHLVLIGEGPARAELEREIVASNMQAHVTLVGQRMDAKRFLRLFGVFVMPSEFEGLGIALLEAMAAGLPCVGTQTGGIPELIKGSGAGLLVPKSDPDALAEAVITLGKAPERRQKMAQKGRSFVEESYSIEQVCHQYQDLYEYLMRRPR